jgi:zinc protease
MWLVYAPVQTDKTKESIAELNKEFDAYLGDRPATAEELSLFVQKRINSLPGQFETAGSVLNSMLSNDRYGRGNDYVPNLKATYAGLDIDAIKREAQENIHPDRLVWLIVGDRAQIEAGVRELGLGDIEIWDANGNKVE